MLFYLLLIRLLISGHHLNKGSIDLENFTCYFQVIYFGLCLPGFLFQFLPFMQQFKIQQVDKLFVATVNN